MIPVDSLYSRSRRSPTRREHPSWAGSRQGQAYHDDRDRRLDHAGRRDWPSPRASCRTSWRSSSTLRSRRRLRPRRPSGARLQPALLKKVDELELSVRSANCPEERQHRVHRRPHPEDGSRDAADPEFRPQVAERIKEVLAQMGLHSAWTSPAGRRRTSRTSRRGSRSTTDFDPAGSPAGHQVARTLARRAS